MFEIELITFSGERSARTHLLEEHGEMRPLCPLPQ